MRTPGMILETFFPGTQEHPVVQESRPASVAPAMGRRVGRRLNMRAVTQGARGTGECNGTGHANRSWCLQRT